jgi:Uma2 family endonuclease
MLQAKINVQAEEVNGCRGDFPLSLQHRVASNNRVLSWRQGSIVATTTKFTFEEFQKLPEREGAIYELDEGELLVEPSPALRHNIVRQRIAMKLIQFVESRSLGIVIEEMDFRLSPDTVRNPDVAFITREHLQSIDLDRSPVDGAPALAVEVISPSNSAQDMAKKTQQYLMSGCRTVWIVYPSLRLVEIYSPSGTRQVREPELLQAEDLLPGFSLSLGLHSGYAQKLTRLR